jgi:hypothetical protein
MQRTPAGLPSGMPGIGELMDGAVQQAPQSGRQSMGAILSAASRKSMPGRAPMPHALQRE